jgi:GT2 family glycosyltransferase
LVKLVGKGATRVELAVIILNWNAAADTIQGVERLAGWTRLQPTIWVVDNASTDGSADMIAASCPTIQLIRNPINLGYAGGNNQALQSALARSDAPILLLNNDAVVAEADVIQMAATLQSDPRIGFVGPLLYDARCPDKLLAAGGQNIVRHLTSHLARLPGDLPVYEVDYVPGTVLLGRAETFRTVGLLDPAYFFTGEIPDLCRRARQDGYQTVVDSRVKAFHALDRSANLRGTLYLYYIIRNRFLFIRKFYPHTRLFYYGFWALYSLGLWLKWQWQGQLASARATRLGLADGWQGRFGDQNERILALTTNLTNV